MTHQAKSNSIRCRNCGHDNLETAKVCIVCDAPLTYTSRFQRKQTVPTGLLPPTEEELIEAQQLEEQKQAEQAAKVAEERSKAAAHKTGTRCPDCGYMNRIGDYFCIECGGTLTTDPRKDSPADITQQMKALTMSDIQAELERQQMEAEAAAEEAAAKVVTKRQPQMEEVIKPNIAGSDFPEGMLQFSEVMFLRFTDITSGHYAEVVPTHNKPLLVGRSHKSLPIQPDVDLTPFLNEQHGVSRRHALIRWRDLRLEMQDLNSTNGTGINGFRFRPKETHEIRNGDVLTLGRVKVKVLFMSKDTGRIGKDTDMLD